MRDRRRWLSALAGGMLLSSGAARAARRPGSAPFRVGWLSVGGRPEAIRGPQFTPGFLASPTGAFVQAFRDLGYVEGRDFQFEFRSAQGVLDRLPRLADELVQWPADVIVASSVAPAIVALQATRTIPIVFVSVPDPVADGLVASLAHPGGNVTGLTTTAGDLLRRMLQMLKEAAPGISRVGLLLSAADTIRDGMFARARELGITPVAGDDIRRPEDIAPAFAAMVRQNAQAFLMLSGQIGYTYREQICALALAHRLPGISSLSAFTEAGLLMSFGADLYDLHRRAAVYVDKIMRGARPADLPVELPTKFELVINLRTARAIGVTISSALQLRADRVIE